MLQIRPTPLPSHTHTHTQMRPPFRFCLERSAGHLWVGAMFRSRPAAPVPTPAKQSAGGRQRTFSVPDFDSGARLRESGWRGALQWASSRPKPRCLGRAAPAHVLHRLGEAKGERLTPPSEAPRGAGKAGHWMLAGRPGAAAAPSCSAPRGRTWKPELRCAGSGFC